MSIAGYDFENGVPIPRMYGMNSLYRFTPTLYDYGYLVSGVSQYALYLLSRLYSADMDHTALEHLGAYVITETATQDGKVGGPVQMALIRPNPAENSALMLNNDEIQVIIAKNERTADDLKKVFARQAVDIKE
jgi:hypothetical protein